MAVLLAIFGIGGAQSCQHRGEGTGEKSSIAWGANDQHRCHREQVLALVAAVSGVPQGLLQESTVELVRLAKDNTPFLSEQIVDRPLCQATIPKWKLQLPSATPGLVDRYERTFDVLVDPVSGNALRIVSRWPQDDPGMPPDVSADRAERQMENSERYHGFPHEKPAITFLQALDVVLRNGSGNPLIARQIQADYVEQSWMGGQPRPVWAITLRGIRIDRLAPAPIDDAADSVRGISVVRQMRNIVDARTGQWLMAINIPNPFSGTEAPSSRPGN